MCPKTHFCDTNDIFIIVTIIYDIGKSSQFQDGCQNIDFDRFCNDSGINCIQN